MRALFAGGSGRRPRTPATKPEWASRSRKFESTKFSFEVGTVKHLRDGRTQVELFVPYEHRDRAVALTDAIGLMLEANIKPVTRKGAL